MTGRKMACLKESRVTVPCLNVPMIWRRWLLDRGSLTQHLRAISGGSFRVLVLQQQMKRPQASERVLLQIPNRGLALVREVLLYGNDQPWVFARSVLPLSTLSGGRRRLRKLDNRPLGALLFTDPTLRRGAMQISRVNSGRLPLSARPSDLDAMLWGRRSVFYLKARPLLVSEIFLPGFCPDNKPMNRLRRCKP